MGAGLERDVKCTDGGNDRRNEAAGLVVVSKTNWEVKEWRVERPNRKEKKKKKKKNTKHKTQNTKHKTHKRVRIGSISSIILLTLRWVQTTRDDGQGAVCNVSYVEQRCLALLMSADAMGGGA